MRRELRGDCGMLAVVVAISTVLLFLVGAFAVDFGMAYNERRALQNAADAGALSGAGDLPSAAPHTAAVTAVKAFVNRSVEPDVDEAEWAACTDPERLTSWSGTQCISFSSGGGRVRVVIPTREVDTILASAAGFSQIPVSAVAEAGVFPDGFSSGVLPFGLPSASSTQTTVCLKTGPSGHAPNTPPCDGPDTGNFGTLDFSLYGNPFLGTRTVCADAQSNGRLVFNMILGVDHLLATLPSPSDPVREDETYCDLDADTTVRPNAVFGQTGGGSNLEPGMVGTDSLVIGNRTYDGRLANTPWQTAAVRQSPAVPLDNRPLWQFFNPSLTAAADIPGSCEPATVTTTAAMVTCLRDYAAGVDCTALSLTGSCTTDLFTADVGPPDPGSGSPVPDGTVDITQTPRFGYVPELHEATWPSGSSSMVRFKAFRPVFIQTTFFGCSATACAATFDPGEWTSAQQVAANKKLDALSALMIPEEALPSSVTANAPGTGFTGTFRIALVK